MRTGADILKRPGTAQVESPGAVGIVLRSRAALVRRREECAFKPQRPWTGSGAGALGPIAAPQDAQSCHRGA